MVRLITIHALLLLPRKSLSPPFYLFPALPLLTRQSTNENIAAHPIDHTCKNTRKTPTKTVIRKMVVEVKDSLATYILPCGNWRVMDRTYQPAMPHTHPNSTLAIYFALYTCIWLTCGGASRIGPHRRRNSPPRDTRRQLLETDSYILAVDDRDCIWNVWKIRGHICIWICAVKMLCVTRGARKRGNFWEGTCMRMNSPETHRTPPGPGASVQGLVLCQKQLYMCLYIYIYTWIGRTLEGGCFFSTCGSTLPTPGVPPSPNY